MSRSWWASARPAWLGWTRRSSPSTQAACRSGTSQSTSQRSMGPRSGGTRSAASPTRSFRTSRHGAHGRWRAGRLYPIVYFDALMVKITEDRSVKTRACYLAVGVTLEGDREILGLWWQDTEGAKFWLAVLNDLHQRGVGDVLIACVDGLAGFPEAIAAVFPQAWVQTCIVHMDPRVDALCQLRRPQAPDARSAPRLQRSERRRGRAAARALRREVGRALPDGRPGLARPVGARHTVPIATRRSTPPGLHDKRYRGTEPPSPQSDQDPRTLPRRASSNKAHLPRANASRDEMGQSDALALSTTSTWRAEPARRQSTNTRSIACRTCSSALSTISSSSPRSNPTGKCITSSPRAALLRNPPSKRARIK